MSVRAARRDAPKTEFVDHILGEIPTVERGAAVAIRDASGRTIAKGVTAYSSADIQRIAGRRTEEAEALLGYRGRPAIIHRDDMVRL